MQRNGPRLASVRRPTRDTDRAQAPRKRAHDDDTDSTRLSKRSLPDAPLSDVKPDLDALSRAGTLAPEDAAAPDRQGLDEAQPSWQLVADLRRQLEKSEHEKMALERRNNELSEALERSDENARHLKGQGHCLRDR